jgi:hypothetical protein
MNASTPNTLSRVRVGGGGGGGGSGYQLGSLEVKTQISKFVTKDSLLIFKVRYEGFVGHSGIFRVRSTCLSVYISKPFLPTSKTFLHRRKLP